MLRFLSLGTVNEMINRLNDFLRRLTEHEAYLAADIL